MQLVFMVVSMICWGSWANTLKLTPGWPIQLFYWDYAAGIVLGTFALGLALGGGPTFLANVGGADSRAWLLAIAGGIVFNVANLLLVAAIDIAGLAVAFPLGIGLALIIGVVLNYLMAPAGNPWLLFAGVVLVAIAIVVDAVAYRRRDTVQQKATRSGIVISIAAGILMGLFYPLVARSMQGPHAFDAYSGAFVFSLGIALCTIPADLWFMKHPLAGRTDHPAVFFRQARLALLGTRGRRHMVRGCGLQLCRIASALCGASHRLWRWPGGHNDHCMLGCLCLA